MEKQQYSPLELKKLEIARTAARNKNYDQARHLLLSIPQNATAQKWLKQLDGLMQKAPQKSKYDLSSQYQHEDLVCSQCQLRLDKGALSCDKRPYGGCPYNHQAKIDFRINYFVIQATFGMILLAIALYLFLLVFLDKTYGYLLIALPFTFFAFLVFRGSVPRIQQLYNPRTEERWQHSSSFGVFYQPTQFRPQSVLRPPLLERPLTYPASVAVLYEQKIYETWEAGFEDVEGKQLAYIMLSTILYMVSLGYIEIWYAPMYQKQPFSKSLSRFPNNDFCFVLTDLGKQTKLTGRLERKIQEALKKSKNNMGYYHLAHDFLPGIQLMNLIMTMFLTGSSSDKGGIQEEKRQDRQRAMKGLLKNAVKLKVIEKKGDQYCPSPELEPILREDASTLAQLMHDYYDMDTEFVKTLHKQIMNHFGHQQSMSMVKYTLGRNPNVD